MDCTSPAETGQAEHAEQHMLEQLFGFVQALCGDTSTRARLADDPAALLTGWGFGPGLPAPGQLGALTLDPRGVCVTIDSATLYGPPAWRAEAPGHYLASTELRLLLAGAKPLVLVHGPERELTQLGAWARTRGYAAVLTAHQFAPREVDGTGGYSNLMTAPAAALPGSGWWRGLLVSSNGAAAGLAWLALLFEWPHLLGALLGYPPCCVQAFARRWPLAQRHYQGDPAIMLLAERGQPWLSHLDWAVNVYARYAGCELVQHFPCELNCTATTRLAQRCLAALQTGWPDDAALLQQRLSAPILVSPGHGVCLFPGARTSLHDGQVVLDYAPHTTLHASRPDPLAEAICADSILRSTAHGHWQVGSHSWPGWLLDFQQ